MTLRIVIPARMGSTRLPDKMVQTIGTKMLVEHAMDRVLAVADPNDVWLATDDRFIASLAKGRCTPVMTSANCRSGTDRCAEAADILGWAADDIVVNVQADMPFLSKLHLSGFLMAAQKPGAWDVMTAYADHKMVELRIDGFVRTAVQCHIGLYAYKRAALKRFSMLPTADAEAAQKLEQMRAIENGFGMAFHRLPEMPFEVNTPQDLAAAQQIAECLK
jgi:3-deoxy-manno-octulosonate cytidylyltransferase (CMP-KDO synthetase)